MVPKPRCMKTNLMLVKLTLTSMAVLSLSSSAMAMGKKKPNPQPDPTPTSTPVQKPIQPVDPSRDSDRNAQQTMELVRYLMVSETRATEDSDEYTPQLLAQLSSEMESCGLTFSGPLCLDSSFVDGDISQHVAYIETRNSFIFISLISKKDRSKKFVLVIEAEKNSNSAPLRSVAVYETPASTKNAEVAKNDFLLGRSQKIIEISTPSKALDFAASELQKSPDFRKLYHFSQLILNTDQKGKLQPIVLQSLNGNYQKITQSNSPQYQWALLNLLRTSFAKERDLLVAVSDELITVQNTNISQLAAITLAERDIKSDLVKAKVRDALSNDNWTTRRLAIYALNQIRSGVDDENLIIGKLGDSDSDVRNAASDVVSSYRLNNEHLPALNSLMKNDSWPVRQVAVVFAGTINTAESTALIIHLLGDSDSDVRNTVYSQLDRRTLTDRELPLLTQHLSNGSWPIRQSAVNLIGKIGTPKAAQALIPQLGDDDNDVRNSTVTALNKYRLTNNELGLLTKLLANPSWPIRQLAVKFIGTIPTAQATAALIPMLGDSDSDVQGSVVALLKARSLTDAEVPLLRSLSNHGSWPVRQSAAYFLGTIKTDQATSALIPMLGDTDNDVQGTVSASMNGRSLNESHMDALGVVLNHSSWVVRQLAARYLGATSSCRALALLKNRAVVESDNDVRGTIANSVKQIQGRNRSCG